MAVRESKRQDPRTHKGLVPKSGVITATTGGYRPVCFDKQSRVSLEWRLSGDLGLDSHLIDAQLGFFCEPLRDKPKIPKILRNHILLKWVEKRR